MADPCIETCCDYTVFIVSNHQPKRSFTVPVTNQITFREMTEHDCHLLIEGTSSLQETKKEREREREKGFVCRSLKEERTH